MIVLDHIVKVFNKGKVNETTALADVSLQINKGEFVVMIGSNGSGKTTLLNIIEGAQKTSGGRVFINNNDVTGLPEHKRSKWIARVFQNPYNGTASELSVLDNFRLAALRTGSRKLTIGINGSFQETVTEKIATLGMGLENKIHLPMGGFSGGQRQALTLLMCTMDHVDILLLDEPTAALDPKSAAVVLRLTEQLIKEYSLTALFITHNLKDALQYGNRLIQMQEGKIMRDLNAAEKAKLALPDMYEWFG
ncbi:MAG TPA: ATP-binding cassette domain-containing protein [Chitinophagaceae bacterium]